MEKKDAIALLQAEAGTGWIGWDDERNEPDTRGGYVTLDGDFNKAELLALAACFPLKD
jgi:hypothetical protein